MRLRVALVVLLSFLAIMTNAVSQTVPAPAKPKSGVVNTPAKKRARPTEQQREKIPWLERAQFYTTQLLDDRAALPGTFQDSLLLARLSDLWWSVDQKRARQWLSDAATKVSYQPQNEKEDSRRDRLHVVGVVASIAAKHDLKVADNLLAKLADAAGRANSAKERSAILVSLNNVSSGILRSNPDLGLQYARNMLEAGLDGLDLFMMDAQLRAHAPEQANTFFNEALAAARTNGDSKSLFQLSDIAYPMAPGTAIAVTIPTALKSALLDAVADVILRVPQSEEEKRRTCSVSLTASRLLKYYPPEKMGIVQSAIAQCQALISSSTRQMINDDANLSTVDDFLDAAKNEPNPKRSASLKHRAAWVALGNKDPVRAIEIMDSFTPEERESFPVWTPEYQHFGTEALMFLHKRNDLQAVQRVFDRAPDNLRANLQLSFAGSLASSGEKPYATVMLQDAQRTLEKYPASDPHTYLFLLGEYAALMPAELPSALRLVANGLNGIEYLDLGSEQDGKRVQFRWSRPAEDLMPVMMADSLVDLDEAFVRASLDSLQDAETRTGFRLGMLQAVLRRYQRDMQKSSKPAQAPHTASQ
jgi:hypothetical protein